MCNLKLKTFSLCLKIKALTQNVVLELNFLLQFNPSPYYICLLGFAGTVWTVL